MVSNKSIKELKKEIKEIDKRTLDLSVEKQAIENKGCFSDCELHEKDRKVNAINKNIHNLNYEKKSLLRSIANIEGKNWIKKTGFC